MEIEDKLHEILGTFGLKLEQDLAESLERNGVVGGGGTASKLAGSIQFIFLRGETGVGITMADYWDYVERGRKPGKKPPIDKIIAWIKWKGIVPKLSDKAKEHSKKISDKVERKSFKAKAIDSGVKSLAYAIATNISKRGTSNRGKAKNFTGPVGTNFVKEVMEDGRIKDLTDIIAKELGLTIVVNVVDDLERTL